MTQQQQANPQQYDEMVRLEWERVANLRPAIGSLFSVDRAVAVIGADDATSAQRDYRKKSGQIRRGIDGHVRLTRVSIEAEYEAEQLLLSLQRATSLLQGRYDTAPSGGIFRTTSYVTDVVQFAAAKAGGLRMRVGNRRPDAGEHALLERYYRASVSRPPRAAPAQENAQHAGGQPGAAAPAPAAAAAGRGQRRRREAEEATGDGPRRRTRPANQERANERQRDAERRAAQEAAQEQRRRERQQREAEAERDREQARARQRDQAKRAEEAAARERDRRRRDRRRRDEEAADAADATAAAAAAEAAADAATAAAAADAAAAAAAARAAATAEADAAEAAAASERRARPVLPQGPADPAVGQWSAIDEVDVEKMIVSPFGHILDIPESLQPLWAEACVDVLSRFFEAQEAADTAGMTRALKWQLCLHDVLLRRPPRGGGRAEARYRWRFSHWQREDYRGLLRSWASDRAAAVESSRRRVNFTAAEETERAVRLATDGELSKSAALLVSKGLGDLSNPRIVEQIERKHPRRKEVIPADYVCEHPIEDIKVELRETYRQLRRRRGTGPDGLRNEHLRALARYFDDGSKAAQAMGLIDRFHTENVNARLPPWYYYATTAVSIVAPIKKRNGTAVDCRPIGMGRTDRRANGKYVARLFQDTISEICAPHQCAIGMGNGTGRMAMGLRLRQETKPDDATILTDKPNAYNEVKRATMISESARRPETAAFGRYAHCTLSPESLLVLGDRNRTVLTTRSSEGGQQGDGIICSAYCLGTLPAIRSLDDYVKQSDGVVRGFVDDVNIQAPVVAALDAVDRYETLLEPDGEGIHRDKMSIYVPALGERLAEVPELQGQVTVAFEDDEFVTRVRGIRILSEGMNILGVPVGTDAYVRKMLAREALKQESYMNTICSKLCLGHARVLYILAVFCIRPRGDFISQTSYPALAAEFFSRVDAALLEVAVRAMGEAGPAVRDDEYARRRFELPGRLKGGAIRPLGATAPAAFVGMLCQVCPTLIDREVGGVTIPGFMPGVEEVFGPGSFDDGGESTRFGGLVSSGTRLGTTLAAAWAVLQLEATTDARKLGRQLDDGPLSVAAAAAGTEDGKPFDKVQRALTKQREELRFEVLAADMEKLSVTDYRRTAFRCCDALSTQIVTAPPLRDMALHNSDWQEAIAAYYGLPSPICSQFAGTPILGNARTPINCFGNVLLNKRLINRDNIRTKWHDCVLDTVLTSLREAGFDVTTRTDRLFADCAPLEALAAPQRSRIVPDASFTAESPNRQLLETKTIAWGPSRYDAAAQRGDRRPVNARAGRIPAEYLAHAKRLDRQHHGTTVRQQGPFELRLQSYGPIVSVVFGNFGEGSTDVHGLLNRAAMGIATRKWASMGARSLPDAHAASLLRLRRSWGFTAIKARAIALREAVLAAVCPRKSPEEAAEFYRRRTEQDRNNHYNFYAAGYNYAGD